LASEEVGDRAGQARERVLAGARDARAVHAREQALLAQAAQGVSGAHTLLLQIRGDALAHALEGIEQLLLAKGRQPVLLRLGLQRQQEAELERRQLQRWLALVEGRELERYRRR
jgi:hypothetical protein